MNTIKILIIAPAWVGDTVMAQSLFKALKILHPEAQIDTLAPDFTHSLLNCMPEVNEIFSLPFKHGEFAFLKRFRLGKLFKKKQYDQAIILPNSWKSALIPFFAGIPKRTGWLGEMRWGLLNHLFYLDKKKYPLMAQRFIVLSEYNLPEDNNITAIKNLYPALQINLKKNFLNNILNNINNTKIIILCPGAEFGSSKRWPEEYYAKTAHYFIQKNYLVWLIGSAKDQPITQKINQLTQNRCEDFAGKTSLLEAVGLLSLAHLVITNDSGLMHIAASLNKNIIALYGSTSPDFTPPLIAENKAKILFINPDILTCRPCFKRHCPLTHHRCMKDIKPSRVIETYEKNYACPDY